MATLKPDETFLVWKNDRAFRSLKDAFFAMERFRETGVTYRSRSSLTPRSRWAVRCSTSSTSLPHWRAR